MREAASSSLVPEKDRKSVKAEYLSLLFNCEFSLSLCPYLYCSTLLLLFGDLPERPLHFPGRRNGIPVSFWIHSHVIHMR